MNRLLFDGSQSIHPSVIAEFVVDVCSVLMGGDATLNGALDSHLER